MHAGCRTPAAVKPRLTLHMPARQTPLWLQIAEQGVVLQLVALLQWSGGGGSSSSVQRSAVLSCSLLCLMAAQPACKDAFLGGGVLQTLLQQLEAPLSRGEHD